ncbi:MAG: 5'-methylthioadenosine/S-adenosylhomocysteine nucleosidase [Agrococcus casei]|uniref:5'-methylthioadenosine/S-adenosylhomocysteine nucleosidase n=1 Tax=Agrococcus casei TaxID=343512 RepID=UPI003F972268
MTEAIRAIAVAAMPAEAGELRRLAASVARLPKHGVADRELLTVADETGAEHQVLLVTSGIGLVNAASALSAALASYSPDFVVSFGSAGGFPARVRVGDVAASSVLTYSVANATAFGYALGQIPGMPEAYAGDPALLERAADAVVAGPMISGDTFVAGDLFDGVAERWPDAVATDMESTALAQVSHAHNLPFVSLRGISDLCGPDAGDEHGQTVEAVSAAAAAAVLTLLR